eukprot:CAMPEP_0195508900 /NCGR_PEP_ID=MMETSP0794_2-20130614/1992_1 /TAXON_ID=515487 /ORGANISM="Stephanopyxis turris, Strain CCMP 815" /LENGTH=458 /DNA_ID=CAMNT_0040635989 /DNA_START=82 /DNA_END=1459 /DNA_ORIENTATION=-
MAIITNEKVDFRNFLNNSSACAAFSIISRYNPFALGIRQPHYYCERPTDLGRKKQTTTGTGSPTALFISNNDNSEGLWKTPNDFRTLLNQCSIQSFMFLLSQMRDPQTMLWLDDFTSPALVSRASDDAEDPDDDSTGKFDSTTKNTNEVRLLKYHGLGAMDMKLFPTWNSYFLQMLKQRPVTYIIESELHHISDYDLDIVPASLCSRILSVRAQIAEEWKRDLKVIATTGGRTLDSYWDNLREIRNSKKRESGKNSTTSIASGNDSDSDDVDTVVGIARGQNLLYLDYDASSDTDNHPSPLRKGNFDLLLLMSTQEAIHRVLNKKEEDYDAESKDQFCEVTVDYLKSFYGMRLLSHFTGNQKYGRTDDFLEELLTSTPKIIEDEKTGKTVLIDPLNVAERILNEREKVALEWQEIVQENSEELTEIRRQQMNCMMGIDCDLEEGEEECVVDEEENFFQ